MANLLNKIVIDENAGYKEINPGDSLESMQVNQNFNFLFNIYKSIIIGAVESNNISLNEVISKFNDIDNNTSDGINSITITCNWFLYHNHNGINSSKVSFYNLKNRINIPNFTQMYYDETTEAGYNFISSAGLILDSQPTIIKNLQNLMSTYVWNVSTLGEFGYPNGTYGIADFTSRLNTFIYTFNIYNAAFLNNQETKKFNTFFSGINADNISNSTNNGVNLVYNLNIAKISNLRVTWYAQTTYEGMWVYASFINIGMYA